MICHSITCEYNQNGSCNTAPQIGERGICKSYSPPESERPGNWFLTDWKLCQCCHAVDEHTYVCVQICTLEDGRYGISAAKVSFSETLAGVADVKPDFDRPTDYVFKGKVFLELASIIASMRNRDYWESGLMDERFSSFDEAKEYLSKIVDCALPDDGDGPQFIQLV